jgi:hypothetical protein
MKPRWWSRLALLAAGFWLSLPALALAQGCAMCGTVGQGSQDPLVRGMYYSILLMVSMPFAVVAVVGGWFVYRTRQGEGPGADHGKPDEPHVLPFRRD